MAPALLFLAIFGADPAPPPRDLQLALASGEAPPPDFRAPPVGVDVAPASATGTAASRPAPADVGHRLLWGVGGSAGFALDQFVGPPFCSWSLCKPSLPGSGPVTGSFYGLGVYGRLGEQFDDFWGAEVELSAGTAVALNEVRGAVTLDITPADWFTFAFGPTAWVDLGPYSDTPADVVAGEIRFDFHLNPQRRTNGRSSFTIGLLGALGATVGGNTFIGAGPAGGAYLTFGWAHY